MAVDRWHLPPPPRHVRGAGSGRDTTSVLAGKSVSAAEGLGCSWFSHGHSPGGSPLQPPGRLDGHGDKGPSWGEG